MSATPGTVRVGRATLAVTPGTEQVLVLHGVGGPRHPRDEDLTAAAAAGAWTVVLAGHAGSDPVRGSAYSVATYATDVVALLATQPDLAPATLVGIGSSAVVAVAVALVAPDLVTGVDLLPRSGGWSVGDALEGTPDRWLDGIPSVAPAMKGEDDPALALGPVAGVGAGFASEFAAVPVTWWSPGTALDGRLAASRRRGAPHWPATPSLPPLRDVGL